MYDSIDITHNKNLYNFDKLYKLISNKELLYNAILIYYILYNKLSNTSLDTEVLDTYSLDDSITSKMKSLEKEMNEKIKKALVNPLANMRK